MSFLSLVKTTADFELRHGVSTRRIAVSAVLTLFPPAMLFLILFNGGPIALDINLVICVFVFLIGLLSLLLWATPNVYSELESRGWIFISSRSGGRISVLLGKYIAAIFNTWVICISSVTLCLLVGDSIGNFAQSMVRLWLGYAALITLAVFAYGAIYSFIGVMFQKRAMVIAVVYTMASDLFLANVPELISKFTVRYYLHGLALDWLDIRFGRTRRGDVPEVFSFPSDFPQFFAILILIGFTVAMLAAAAYVIRYREYITNDEA